MKFNDENGAAFIATIYDSDEKWQDPQVLDFSSTINEILSNSAFIKLCLAVKHSTFNPLLPRRVSQ